MNYAEIEEILQGQPKYRIKQVKKAVFSDLIDDWAAASTLPGDLRNKLAKTIPLSGLKAGKILESSDGKTIKGLFILEDGSNIESVLMKHASSGALAKEVETSRNTVCVSSQVGCAINCQFCATGQQGLKRNLETSEIIDQVLFFARLLKKTGEKVSNVVFMGMGEPLLNYNNVLEAVKILNDKDGLNIGARRISVSTCGITEGIENLAEEKTQINLAISLHAPNDELRGRIMPINKKYSVGKILEAVDKYIEKTKRRVMFEYLMMDGVNDSVAYAEELVYLLKNSLHFGNQKNFARADRKFYFVNLISFNPVGHSVFKPSPGWKIKQFREILEKSGIDATQRYRFGEKIKAACGQLTSDANN